MNIDNLSLHNRLAFDVFDKSLLDRTGNSYRTYTQIYPKTDILKERHFEAHEPSALVSAFIMGWKLKTRNNHFSLDQVAIYNRQIIALRDFADEMNPSDAPDNWRPLSNGGIARQITPEKGLLITGSLENNREPIFNLQETKQLRFSEKPYKHLYEILPTEPFKPLLSGSDINKFSHLVLTYEEREAILLKNKAPRPKIDEMLTREIKNLSAQRELGSQGPSFSPSPF